MDLGHRNSILELIFVASHIMINYVLYCTEDATYLGTYWFLISCFRKFLDTIHDPNSSRRINLVRIPTPKPDTWNYDTVGSAHVCFVCLGRL